MTRCLWLIGPSGVGKTTAGWLLHRRWAAAYVDTDQLGLCYPTPPDDPGNHRLKAANLAALRFPPGDVVVSGGLPDRATAHAYFSRRPDWSITVCRLRASEPELRARILARGGPLTALADEAVADARALDRADFADLVVDTDALTADQVVDRVLAALT
ncbi:hypothetical protein [Saccharothrix obliqua]|uniref:hypothetical protein n=1 Tax=Saccharothrix obliqua TaxID=2861747 RepID=UPI001C5EB08A|nr:hypothetical protein [Saccharothrix obliqua]MBW4721420.1 hypothetical protein [Saccharothrix obliqua]